MIEIIPSKHAREALQGKRVFTDFEKATLIWNSPIANIKEKFASLKELSEITNDMMLKKQIEERIEYEKKAYDKFVENAYCHYIFVVFDEEFVACGYLSEYELARQFGIKICAEYKMSSFVLEKQLIFGEQTKSEVMHPWYPEHSVIDHCAITEAGYDGRENVRASYNAMGEMKNFYSNEMPDIDYETSADNARFEDGFFKIPAVIESGTVAKIVGKDTYVVLDDSMSSWDEYMERIIGDFSDIQIPVYRLLEDGSLSHIHVNPLFLEPMVPEIEKGNEKSKAYVNALLAVGEYFKELTEETDSKALDACRKYADICAQDKRRVYRVNSICNLLR